MNNIQLNGGCACGSIRYECEAEPIHAYKCHCRGCQQASGGGSMGIIWVYSTNLRVTKGTPHYYAVQADSGRQLDRGFCSNCGSNVLIAPLALKGITFIVASSLDDPSLFEPRIEMWASCAHHWDHVDKTLLVFEGQPSDKDMLELGNFRKTTN